MKRAPAAVLLGAVVIAAVGCAASSQQEAASRPTGPPARKAAVPVAIRYQPENLTLYAAPSGYRPAISAGQVLELYRKSSIGPKLNGTPTVRLWMVNDRKLRRGRRNYAAWVITFQHTKPLSYGPASASQRADCASVAIYDLRTRVWTEDFQNCHGRRTPSPSCDPCTTPVNQPLLDAAAGDAKRIVAQYFTGVVVDDEANKVVVYLAHAPQSALDKLRAGDPGTFVIHNDAPRTMRVVLALQHNISWSAWKAHGIDIVSTGPTQTGYLQVGVTTNVVEAQAAFDAKYGPGIVRAVKGHVATAVASPARPSLNTDLRLTKNVPCPNGRRPPVGPMAVRRFRAVAAVSCVSAFRTYPHDGQWEVLVRRVAVGNVSALQKYFEQPSRRHVPKGEVCPAVLIVTLVPVFVDARGHWLLPVTPRGGCGQPLAGGPPNIRWHVVRVRRIRQLVSAPALSAHCAMRVGNVVAWAGPPRNAPAAAPLFDRMPKRVHVCVYRTPPNNFATGNFVRGFLLGAARTRRLLRALTGPGPKRGCPKQRTFAGINASRRFGATVELGGCYRVATAEGARTANPAVIRAILGRR